MDLHASQEQTIFLADMDLLRLADIYYTPLYVFDEATIRQRCAELKRCITYSTTRIRYACKALTLRAVLQIVRSEGLWIDASSINEVQRAILAGFRPSEIYYTGECATAEVYRNLVQNGVLINCTFIDQIKLLASVKAVNSKLQCSMRITPGDGHGEITKTNTGGPCSKHGIYLDQIEDARSTAAANGIKVIGVHSHIGS